MARHCWSIDQLTRLLKAKQEIHVGISEYKIAQFPNKLMTVGLGSCIGTIIYDEKSKIGGLSHIMLPDSQPFMDKREINPGKFADLAIPAMVAELKHKVRGPQFKAKIVGGANMFQFQTVTNTSNIGQRNIEAVEQSLAALRIPIIARHVGGTTGRTMIVDLADFTTMVRIVNQETIYL
jgi:chemotaxis protein CheD